MTICVKCGHNASPEASYCIMYGTRLKNYFETDYGIWGSLKNLVCGNVAEDELTV